MSERTKVVVIVGGGGGLSAAQHLHSNVVDVTVTIVGTITFSSLCYTRSRRVRCRREGSPPRFAAF